MHFTCPNTCKKFQGKCCMLTKRKGKGTRWTIANSSGTGLISPHLSILLLVQEICSVLIYIIPTTVPSKLSNNNLPRKGIFLPSELNSSWGITATSDFIRFFIVFTTYKCGRLINQMYINFMKYNQKVSIKCTFNSHHIISIYLRL